MPNRNMQPADVTAVVGDLHASKVAAIIASGATRQEVEQAYALAQENPDALPLGPVGEVYRILTADDELWSVGTDE